MSSLAYKQCFCVTLTELILCRRVTHVIHCASAIRFDLHISDVLKQNFVSTRELLKLSLSFAHLKAWCYVSTAFVNLNMPADSKIEERIYPLSRKSLKRAGANDELDLAEIWLSLAPDDAQKSVSPS